VSAGKRSGVRSAAQNAFFSKALIFGTFTAGTWLCFAAFLMSMAAVKDHGSNRLAASAFFITFLSAFVTIYLATEM